MQDTLDAIKKHGLAIRQIPWKVVSVCDIRHWEDGDEIVQREVKRKVDGVLKRVLADYCKKTKIPENAGHWMCQQVTHASSMVRWSMRDHNLAPTLEESIQLFLSSLEEQTQ